MIASETASRHQPIIGVILYGFRHQSRSGRFPMRSTQRLVPYSENKGYASNPRHFQVLVTVFVSSPVFADAVSVM